MGHAVTLGAHVVSRTRVQVTNGPEGLAYFDFHFNNLLPTSRHDSDSLSYRQLSLLKQQLALDYSKRCGEVRYTLLSELIHLVGSSVGVTYPSCLYSGLRIVGRSVSYHERTTIMSLLS